MSDFDDWFNTYKMPCNDDSGDVEQQMKVAFTAGAAAQIEKDAVLAEQYWGIAAVNKIAAAIRAQLKD